MTKYYRLLVIYEKEPLASEFFYYLLQEMEDKRRENRFRWTGSLFDYDVELLLKDGCLKWEDEKVDGFIVLEDFQGVLTTDIPQLCFKFERLEQNSRLFNWRFSLPERGTRSCARFHEWVDRFLQEVKKSANKKKN